MSESLARFLLRLFPPAWRERYGCEVQALLDDQGVSTSSLIDLSTSLGREWASALVRRAGERGRLVFAGLAETTAWSLVGVMAVAAAFPTAGWLSHDDVHVPRQVILFVSLVLSVAAIRSMAVMICHKDPEVALRRAVGTPELLIWIGLLFVAAVVGDLRDLGELVSPTFTLFGPTAARAGSLVMLLVVSSRRQVQRNARLQVLQTALADARRREFERDRRFLG